MRRNAEFQTIRSEGGLLPPDLLRRVLDPNGDIEGTRPHDYGLPESERLNEVITQTWNRLRKHWSEFREAMEKLPEGEAGTGLTNERWSLPLLRELGFGVLSTSQAPEIGGRIYAINRFHGPVPLHLIGCGLSLDRRTAGARGAASANPHGLVQEFLNRSEPHLWAIVTNGRILRVLRDNQALSRQSYLEFDLEGMFTGEVYSDFVLLWMMVHATRFMPSEANRPETCWLEKWTKVAEEQGTRALGDLRGGVEKALQILGEGFTSHPKNVDLRDSLRSGDLPLTDFHGQVLRVVYRLIFLFVAEDRTIDGIPLLHPRDDSEDGRLARERYASHYSTARLRELAGQIKGSRHGDLWRQFQILVHALSGSKETATARIHLALPALGSFLWDPRSTTSLNALEISNSDLLRTIRRLAYIRHGRVLRPVDYRNLGAEEFGGVYESLLALTPQISGDGARFTFEEFGGNERKLSGSYYTPDSLVQCVLDSALNPVVDDAIRGKNSSEAERAILRLKVCDPAVGSGHFLIGAAHRLARHLSRVRAQQLGESEPSPMAYQQALRDVIGRCLYGVDINPMSAELCRVGLWLEALEPGKPLSFLDHHIRVGNSLLGASPELIATGIPDCAFGVIGSDEQEACSILKSRNRSERSGWGPLFARQDTDKLASLRKAVESLDLLPDDRPADIRAKERALDEIEQTDVYRKNRLLADTWCAAMVCRKYFKTPGLISSVTGITQRHLTSIAADEQVDPSLLDEVFRLATKFCFFHWHLAFPEVFSQGGFDCVLGNPPWEMMESGVGETASDTFARLQHYFKSNQYSVLNGRRDLYKLFLVSAMSLPRAGGRLGFITPLGIFIEDHSSKWRTTFFDTGTVYELRHFQNHRKAFFLGLHASYRFCSVVYGAGEQGAHEFTTVARTPEEIPTQIHVFVPRDEYNDWLGRSRAATIYPNRSYALLHRHVLGSLNHYQQVDYRVVAEFHASTDRTIISREPIETSHAVLKNRNIHIFDHEFAPHEAWVTTQDLLKRLTRKKLEGEDWAYRYPRLVFRDIARNDDERTLISCLAPPTAVSSYDTPMFVPNCGSEHYPKWIAFFSALMSSFMFDFLIRPYVDKHIKGYTLARIAWPTPDSLIDGDFGLDWIVGRVIDLVYRSDCFMPFARDCGDYAQIRAFSEEQRAIARCEIDAAVFYNFLPASSGAWNDDSRPNQHGTGTLEDTFSTPETAIDFILDTFPIVREKDARLYGSFSTKEAILDIYSRIVACGHDQTKYKRPQRFPL